MRIRFKYIFLSFCFCLSFGGFSQTASDTLVRYSDVNTLPPEFLGEDVSQFSQEKLISGSDFKPDPRRSVWLGAIIPGYGQIVNKKYWKLPFIYGGFVAVSYVANWNAQQHQTYKLAYRDIIDNDPTTNSFLEILPQGYTVEQIFGSEQRYRDHLKMAYDKTRRMRDLWMLGTIMYCGLTVLEAYVDASLYDFDVSPDLSMKISPAIMTNDLALRKDGINRLSSNNSFGLKCALHLK